MFSTAAKSSGVSESEGWKFDSLLCYQIPWECRHFPYLPGAEPQHPMCVQKPLPGRTIARNKWDHDRKPPSVVPGVPHQMLVPHRLNNRQICLATSHIFSRNILSKKMYSMAGTIRKELRMLSNRAWSQGKSHSNWDLISFLVVENYLGKSPL